MVFLPFSIFFFIHHVDPIIEEVESGTEASSDSMVVQVYDPSSSRVYAHFLKAELAISRETLAQALKDRAHAENEAHKWFMIGDYFYKKKSLTVKALFFLSIATLPRYVSSKLYCSIDYLGLFGEIVVNPRTFIGFCCKDWGSRGDLRFVPVTHIQVSDPGNQIELPGRKLAVDSR
ncbi:hypothetical protein JHK86_039618 [Glycine max]|nr:hypothetical protein JHK86_039618 [Glycine max]